MWLERHLVHNFEIENWNTYWFDINFFVAFYPLRIECRRGDKLNRIPHSPVAWSDQES